MREIWSILYKAGADVTITSTNGSRRRTTRGNLMPRTAFARSLPAPVAVVCHKIGKIAPNSEVRDNTAYGVLKLTIAPGRYAWEFVPMSWLVNLGAIPSSSSSERFWAKC